MSRLAKLSFVAFSMLGSSLAWAQSAEDQFLDHMLQKASPDGTYDKFDDNQKIEARKKIQTIVIEQVPFFKALDGASKKLPLKSLIDPKTVQAVELRHFLNSEFISVNVNGDTHLLIDTKGFSKADLKAFKASLKASPRNAGALLVGILGDERMDFDKWQTMESLKQNKAQLWLRSAYSSGRIWDNANPLSSQDIREKAYQVFDKAL